MLPVLDFCLHCYKSRGNYIACILCLLCTMYFSVHLWYDTCWSLGGKHGIQGISSTYLHLHTGIGGGRVKKSALDSLGLLLIWLGNSPNFGVSHHLNMVTDIFIYRLAQRGRNYVGNCKILTAHETKFIYLFEKEISSSQCHWKLSTKKSLPLKTEREDT